MMLIDFANDIKDLILNNWVQDYGNRPPVKTAWNVKAIGHGQKLYDIVIIDVDAENIDIFSLKNEDGYDWLHDGNLSLDIRTSASEERVVQITKGCIDILKNNVLLSSGGRDYIQVIPNGTTSLNESYRNLFRMNVSLSGLRFNP